MQNPFINNNIIVQEQSQDVTIDKLNIGKYFKHVYFLCPMSSLNDTILQAMNSLTIDPIIMEMLLFVTVLYKAPISIVKNPTHFNNTFKVPSDSIQLANKFGYQLDELILVIPILTISFLDLHKYIDNVVGENNLDKLYNILVLNNYFGDRKINILSIISDLNESKYWTLEQNCNFNMTKLFNKRQFNFANIRISSELTTIINSLESTRFNENYLDEIFSTKKYTDPSAIINRNGFRLYNVVKQSNYTKNDIVQLFAVLDKKQKILCFNQLIVSRVHCHLVVNNLEILVLMADVIKQYSELYQYLLGYAWLRFYFEESITRTFTKTTDMFIFDCNTASKLPVFKFDYNNPHKNPYMPILVALHSLNPTTNIGGIELSDDCIVHRICTISEFKERFNIFTTGSFDKDLFQDINFSELKMGITGSAMTACLQYMHPLLELFKTPENNTMNLLYNRYFNEYYGDSDIDIMINTSDMLEFLDIGKKIYEKISHNIMSLYAPYAQPENIHCIITKQIYLFVTTDFIKSNICTSELTYEVIVGNLNKNVIVKLFTDYIHKCHNETIIKFLEAYTDEDKEQLKQKYPEYFEFKMENVMIKLYDTTMKSTMRYAKTQSELSEEEIENIIEQSNKEDNIIRPIMTTDINMTFGFKIKISSPMIDHDLELFPIKGGDFMGTVAGFHMPCVRAYYNGTNAYMLPSFISSQLTFMGPDMKYFAGSKDPIEIINKYRMRGYGTWLNKGEIVNYIKYSSLVPKWNNLLSIVLDKKSSSLLALGPLNINHRMFKPRQFNAEYYTNEKIKPIPFDNPYQNHIMQAYTSTPYEYLNNRYGALKIDIPETLQTIDKNTGYVKPFIPYIVNLM